MAAHFQYSQHFAFPFNSTVQVPFYYSNTFSYGWRRQVLACTHVMLYFIKYPGVANSTTANHDAVHSVAVLVFQRFFRAVDIAVTKYRHANTLVVFYPGNPAPVGLALIHLRT